MFSSKLLSLINNIPNLFYKFPIVEALNMQPIGFKCKQCGSCCINLRDAFETCATEEDVQLWEEEGREDILAWVDPIPLGEEHFVYDIWISPITGDDVPRCPWLRKLPKKNKYICRIHDVKPLH